MIARLDKDGAEGEADLSLTRRWTCCPLVVFVDADGARLADRPERHALTI